MRRRLLAAWIVVCLVAGLTAAARHPADDRVTAEPGELSLPPFKDGLDRPPPRRPSTTVPSTAARPTTTTTHATPPPSSTAAAPAAPMPAAPHLDRPGVWIVRPNGSEARFVGDVGLGGRRGGAYWGPDSRSFYGLMTSPEDGHNYLVRTDLDGGRRWYGLPPAPAGPGTPSGPRWMFQYLHVGGGRAAFSWVREDPLIGVSLGSLDLSHIIDLEERYAGAPVVSRDGELVAVAAEGVTVLDRNGRLHAGPFQLGDGGQNAAEVVPADWSSDRRHFLVRVGEAYCVIDISSGACPTRDLTVAGASATDVVMAPNGQSLLVEVLRPGASSIALYLSSPAGRPQVLTDDGSHGVWSPAGEAVFFSRSPYINHRSGAASLHVVAADGSAQRLVATTSSYVASPFAWSPDGQWVAVNVGSQR